VTRSLSPSANWGKIGLQVGYGGTLIDRGAGDWVSGGHCNPYRPGFSFYLMSQGCLGAWTTVTIGTQVNTLDVTHEKYAAPGQGLWVTNWWPQGVLYIDVNRNTVVTLHTGTTATIPGNAYEVLPLHDRDLGSRRTGKATWDLFINPGAGAHAGKPYVIAASLAQSRPGFKLADGREVYIGLDPLAMATATGPLPPLITGNVGTLDAQGMAVARIDLKWLGVSANSTGVHFCAVVFDQAAPSGIAWVCDPHAFVIDVLP